MLRLSSSTAAARKRRRPAVGRYRIPTLLGLCLLYAAATGGALTSDAGQARRVPGARSGIPRGRLTLRETAVVRMTSLAGGWTVEATAGRGRRLSLVVDTGSYTA